MKGKLITQVYFSVTPNISSTDSISALKLTCKKVSTFAVIHLRLTKFALIFSLAILEKTASGDIFSFCRSPLTLTFELDLKFKINSHTLLWSKTSSKNANLAKFHETSNSLIQNSKLWDIHSLKCVFCPRFSRHSAFRKFKHFYEALIKMDRNHLQKWANFLQFICQSN